MAVKLRNLKDPELGSVGWGAVIAWVLSGTLLVLAFIEYLIAAPELAAGVTIEKAHVWWPMSLPTLGIAVIVFLLSVPIFFGHVVRTVAEGYQQAATQTAFEAFPGIVPEALTLRTPTRGRQGLIPSFNFPKAWEWDLPFEPPVTWRVELDADHDLVRASSRGPASAAWSDLGGPEPWWDSPPAFSPHRRLAGESSVEPPPSPVTIGAWIGRLTVSVVTVVATATIYFSTPSWGLFAIFVILVPFVAWISRRSSSNHLAAEQTWRIALAAALTRYCTISDLDALQITAGRMRRHRHRVIVQSRILSGPAMGRWRVTVNRSNPEVLLERLTAKGRFRTMAIPIPATPDIDGHL